MCQSMEVFFLLLSIVLRTREKYDMSNTWLPNVFLGQIDVFRLNNIKLHYKIIIFDIFVYENTW